jgi:hypothetical protein
VTPVANGDGAEEQPVPESQKQPSPTVADVGSPGSSLQAEYEQRSAAREARTRARHPRIGGFLLAVTNHPASNDGLRDRRGR